jgi:hypothetical protein
MDQDDVLDEPTDTEMRIFGFGNNRERAATALLPSCGAVACS